MLEKLLKKLSERHSLTEDETYSVFEELIQADSKITDAQIGAYLFSTAERLPTVDELVGAARSLRKHMLQLNLGISVLDTAGTGGSGFDSFNTSTAAALVAAAAGQVVAKHGNRGVTSRSGSVDVLEALGMKIDLGLAELQACVNQAKFCFLFAPVHHGATKRAAAIRKQLGVRTIFNFIGPLTNPAGAVYQLLGVSRREMVRPLAEALLRLGSKRALVVCGHDGLDEITLTGPTHVAELNGRQIKEYDVKPEDFELRAVEFSAIKGLDAKGAAEKIRAVFAGEAGAYRDLILLNAGAALFAAEKATSLADGLCLAAKAIDSGAALKTLEAVCRISHQ